MHRYAIEILYSEEDGGYIATVPELPECSAFGETGEEALKEIKIAIDLWLETARGYIKHKTKSISMETS